MKKNMVLGMSLLTLVGITVISPPADYVQAQTRVASNGYDEPTTDLEKSLEKDIKKIADQYDIMPQKAILKNEKNGYTVLLYCYNFYLADWNDIFEMYSKMTDVENVNKVVFCENDEQYNVYSKMNSIEIAEKDYKYVGSWDNKKKLSSTGPSSKPSSNTNTTTYSYSSSAKRSQTQSDSGNNSSNNNSSSFTNSRGEEAHPYDKSDPFYSINDYDDDGKLTDEEFTNALNDAITYYYYKSQMEK